jgi:hypothetical protein
VTESGTETEILKKYSEPLSAFEICAKPVKSYKKKLIDFPILNKIHRTFFAFFLTCEENSKMQHCFFIQKQPNSICLKALKSTLNKKQIQKRIERQIIFTLQVISSHDSYK